VAGVRGCGHVRCGIDLQLPIAREILVDPTLQLIGEAHIRMTDQLDHSLVREPLTSKSRNLQSSAARTASQTGKRLRASFYYPELGSRAHLLPLVFIVSGWRAVASNQYG
jgi:hypothetical protein